MGPPSLLAMHAASCTALCVRCMLCQTSARGISSSISDDALPMDDLSDIAGGSDVRGVDRIACL